MTSWATLNISYTGDWTVPELFLREIRCLTDVEDCSFDLVLDTYGATSAQHERAIQVLSSIAQANGAIDCLVAIYGDDTTNRFTVEEVTPDGDTIQTWTKADPLTEDWFEHRHANWDDVMDYIEDDIGYRPTMGGGYK